MREILVNVVAASSMAIGPVASSEAGSIETQLAYIREEDESINESSTFIPEDEKNKQAYRTASIKRAGHFVHHFAARSNQVGHRFRADTR